MFRSWRARGVRLAGVMLAALSVAVLAGSGVASASSSAAGTGSVQVTAHGGCGTVPAAAPDDPAGVIRKLGATYEAAYQGFADYPIVRSPWVNWKPKQKSGWNVQLVWQPLVDPFTADVLHSLESALKASGKVSTIGVQLMDSVTDVPQQIQQMQTAVQRRPNLIIVFPASPQALVPVIAQAAKAGIPTISEFESTPSNYAVSINQNEYLAESLPVAGILKAIGGKGNVLEVNGIPGIAGEVDTARAWKAALSRCPRVHVVGAVYGEYTDSVTKGQVEQYLATHPSPLQAVFQEGTMGPGVLAAFQQTGHTPPPLADVGSTQGSLAYMHDHRSYKLIGIATPEKELGVDTATVAIKMLEGDGVKLNTLLSQHSFVVSRQNLNKVWKPYFEENSQVGAAPPFGLWMPKAYLNGFFARNDT